MKLPLEKWFHYIYSKRHRRSEPKCDVQGILVGIQLLSDRLFWGWKFSITWVAVSLTGGSFHGTTWSFFRRTRETQEKCKCNTHAHQGWIVLHFFEVFLWKRMRGSNFFNKNKSYDILRETRQKKNKTQTTRTKEKNRSKTFLFRPVFIFKNL